MPKNLSGQLQFNIIVFQVEQKTNKKLMSLIDFVVKLKYCNRLANG